MIYNSLFLYSHQTRTVQDKKVALSARREAWKQAHAKAEDVGQTNPPLELRKTDSSEQNSNHLGSEIQSEQQKDKDVDLADHDLQEITTIGYTSCPSTSSVRILYRLLVCCDCESQGPNDAYVWADDVRPVQF